MNEPDKDSKEELTMLEAMALANHALLIKLLIVLRDDAVISSSQLQRAIDSARSGLEANPDTKALRASLILENVRDQIAAD